MIEKWYYITYLLLAGIQFLIGFRNLNILIDADRWRSYAFVATLLILSINGIDMFFIGMLASGLYRLPQNTMTAHMFWFGIRNLCSIGYWFGWAYLLILTYTRCHDV